jgi:hypothetical protein
MAKLVFDPRGRVPAPSIHPAARVASLDGLRIGVLNNTKWNAAKLLRGIVAALGSDVTHATVHHYSKESYTRAAPPALLDHIRSQNDVALVAIGD